MSLKIKKLKISPVNKERIESRWYIAWILILLLLWNQQWTNHKISSSWWVLRSEMSKQNQKRFDEMIKLAKGYDNKRITSDIERTLRYWNIWKISYCNHKNKLQTIQVIDQKLPIFPSWWVRIVNKEDADTNGDWKINDKELWEVLDDTIDALEK